MPAIMSVVIKSRQRQITTLIHDRLISGKECSDAVIFSEDRAAAVCCSKVFEHTLIATHPAKAPRRAILDIPCEC